VDAVPPQQDEVEIVVEGLVGQLTGVEAADGGVVGGHQCNVPRGQPAPGVGGQPWLAGPVLLR
jgi:hypothetical protein